jgi:hypothetical protein
VAADRGWRHHRRHAARAGGLQAIAARKPGAGWVKTAERFIDPDTGQPVDVFYNPASGERQYVSQEPQKKA